MSTINLNLRNVEELVFQNKEIIGKLPEYRHLFDQWRLGKLSPALRQFTKKSLMDFINTIKDEHIQILEGHFGVKVTLDKLDYHTVKLIQCKIDEAEEVLNNTDGYSNFTTSREGDDIYLCFWR